MLFQSAFVAAALCGTVIADTQFTAMKAVAIPRVARLTPRNGGLTARQVDTCFTGKTCADCFGAGYIECPNDSSMCYDPATQDKNTACSSSGGSGGSGGSSPPMPTPSAPSGGSGGVDTCYTGKSCADCFGKGYIECPNDSSFCYNPATQDKNTACSSSGGSGGSSPSGGSGGSGGSSPSVTSPLGGGSSPTPTFGGSGPAQTTESCFGKSCSSCFGHGYTTCPGSDSDCYNPSLGPASQFCPSSTGSLPSATGSSHHNAAGRLDGHHSFLAAIIGAVGMVAAI